MVSDFSKVSAEKMTGKYDFKMWMGNYVGLKIM